MKIIGVHIKQRSGKSVIRLPGYKVMSFQDLPKQMTSLATGIPIERMDNEEVFNSYLSEEWSYIREERFVSPLEGVSRKPVRYHLSAKNITEKIYNMGRDIHSDFWVNMFFANVRENTIITFNFPNELMSLKDRGYPVILLEIDKTRSILDDVRSRFDYTCNSVPLLEKFIKETEKK